MPTERNQAIVSMYQEGYSLADVGAEYGISRERVRQILVLAGLSARHYGALKREALDTVIEAAYERIRIGVSSVNEEAAKLSIKPDSLRLHFRNRGWPLPRQHTATHGTRWYYRRYQCRCDVCRAANLRYMKSLRGKEPPHHGTYSGYQNYRCRCDACRKAGVEYRNRRNSKFRVSN